MSNLVQISEEFKDLVPKYLENLNWELNVLNEVYKFEQVKRVEEVAHKIKGSAGTYGFKVIHAMAQTIELAAMHNKLKDVEPDLDDLNEYVKDLEIVYFEDTD